MNAYERDLLRTAREIQRQLRILNDHRIDGVRSTIPELFDFTERMKAAQRKLSACATIDTDAFIRGYTCCALTRNLQMLGAFGYLSRVKNKPFFKAYIPTALESLKHTLSNTSAVELPDLKSVVNCL